MDPRNDGRDFSTPKYNPGIPVYHDSWQKPGAESKRTANVVAAERLGGKLRVKWIVAGLG